MTRETAEARGRVTIRPWRVGLVIDTKSPSEVGAAIANLSSVWGGALMPIFDKNSSIADLENAGNIFDVDSLYAEEADGPLAEFLGKPGWAWRGGARRGPFDREGDLLFGRGLLQIHAISGPPTRFVLPVWDRDHPSDLVLAGIWGLRDNLRMPCTTVPLEFLTASGVPSGTELGVLRATLAHATTTRWGGGDSASGLHILRPGHPEDVVNFWNHRAYGNSTIGIPADADPGLLAILLSQPLPDQEWINDGSGAAEKIVRVFGLEHATEGVAAAVREAANQAGLSIRPDKSPPTPRFSFPGVGTRFTRSVRVDFRPEAHWIDIDLPILPLVEDPEANPFSRGVVAAQLELSGVQGQDPRLTSLIPPYRRMSALVEYLPFIENTDHIRASHEGLILGLDASTQDVRAPFSYNLDVLRVLFDDESATVEQSDVGKFQTRAAEKFGGLYSGLFCQPGVRAAINLAVGKAAGVTLPHLRNVIRKNRGGWPNSVMDHETPEKYAERSLNKLFHSGLFVPTLKVHCSHCRVESFVSADQLGSTMQCEFCGEPYNLALSHGLSKPEWRYRLAAHLRADQVEALLPALATTSLLQMLRYSDEPAAVTLGFRVTIGGKAIEADIAAYIPEPEWLAVLGEVKNANRIDVKDIANLEFLRAKLRAKRVGCLLVFATLKDRFTVEEVTALRGLVERSSWVATRNGLAVPDVPMVLTGIDLSHNDWDDDHPRRWKTGNYVGMINTAMVSCQRNLGLLSYSPNRNLDEPDITFEWDDAALPPSRGRFE
jgi:hypothetical protein